MSEPLDSGTSLRRLAAQGVAILAARVGVAHLEAVEDALQEALLVALRQWPHHGPPAQPLAWLVAVAKHRFLDAHRRRRREVALEEAVAAALPPPPEEAPGVWDDQLHLVFVCCHPANAPAGQLALVLKVVGGFTPAEIARALLAREAAVKKVLARARGRLKALNVPVAMPPEDRLPARLEAVRQGLYLLFNEGHSALAGDAAVREEMGLEALRLAELLAAHPRTGTPATHALAALLCFQASRLATRCDAEGHLVLLADQDRTRWDRPLIDRGLRHLRAAGRGDTLTPLHLEAEIAACHALAPTFAATDWPRILTCYDALVALTDSPVVALNRGVALAQVGGPAAALETLARLTEDPRMAGYGPYHVALGELLTRAGRRAEAQASFQRALALPTNAPLRRHLQGRAGAP